MNTRGQNTGTMTPTEYRLCSLVMSFRVTSTDRFLSTDALITLTRTALESTGGKRVKSVVFGDRTGFELLSRACVARRCVPTGNLANDYLTAQVDEVRPIRCSYSLVHLGGRKLPLQRVRRGTGPSEGSCQSECSAGVKSQRVQVLHFFVL